MSYTRNFITFVCEAEGYGFGGKKPSGSCVLEARGNEGKLSCFAQNIKPEIIYSVYLLFPDSGRFAAMPAGKLSADAGGRAQARFTFPADKILGGRYVMEDCAAVTVLVTRASEPTAPLCGYLRDPFKWRHGFYDATVKKALYQEEAPAEAQAPAPILEPPSEASRDYEPETYATPEAEAQAAYEYEVAATEAEAPPSGMAAEAIGYEYAVEPEYNYAAEAPAETPAANYAPPIVDGYQTSTHTSAQARREMSAAIDALFEKYPPECPFQRQNRSAKWVRVSAGDNLPMPLNAPNLLAEPFVKNLYNREGHLLVGVTEGAPRRQFILGVPDRYDPTVKVKANLLGFTQFKPCDDVRITRGLKGYWLMFVNL